MLEQDENQRSSGTINSNISHPVAFQVIKSANSVSGSILYPQYYKKHVSSHCGKLYHIVDKYYKVHGFSSGYRFKPKYDSSLYNYSYYNMLASFQPLKETNMSPNT